ncbi:MAG: PAS domain S-box protein, partial [Methanomassiliicoccales archaeon]|nr:PAS domain S-box protein [Methanomassiliicoccales archaeon]
MINILYVDDDTDLLEITKEFLESSNEFLVDTSSSVQAAGVALRKKNYQAVVSDYQMPEKDGLCFLRDLKRKGNDIPFILFTGKGREEVAIKALNLGADFYLVKGGEPRSQFAELANMIKQAVGKREAEKVLNHYLKHFKELIENSTDIIAEIDESGNLKYVTPSVIRMLGYSPNELIGTPIADIVHPNDLEHFTKFLKVVIKVGKTTNLEMKIVTKDGDWRILNVSGKVVMNETRSIVINAHDITEKILMSNKIKNLIRTLTVLSEVNHIIVRTNDRDQLFQKVCHAAVEKGDFALAWI